MCIFGSEDWLIKRVNNQTFKKFPIKELKGIYEDDPGNTDMEENVFSQGIMKSFSHSNFKH